MATRRVERVNAEIQKEISNILLFKVDNKIINQNMVSITEVDITSDLSIAKVYFTVFKKENEEAVLNALKISLPFIRKEVGKAIKLRIVPKLTFMLDTNMDKVNHIESLIHEINKK